MIFKPNGKVIFESADRVALMMVRDLNKKEWVKSITYQFHRIPHTKREKIKVKWTEKKWSDDVVRILSLYGLEMYRKKTGIRQSLLSFAVGKYE